MTQIYGGAGTCHTVQLLQQQFLLRSTVSQTENKGDKERSQDQLCYLVRSCFPSPFWLAEFAPWWLFAKEPSVPWMIFCVPPFLPMMHSGECPFLDLTNDKQTCWAFVRSSHIYRHKNNIPYRLPLQTILLSQPNSPMANYNEHYMSKRRMLITLKPFNTSPGIVSLDFDGVTTLWKIVCNAIMGVCFTITDIWNRIVWSQMLHRKYVSGLKWAEPRNKVKFSFAPDRNNWAGLTLVKRCV